MKSNKMDGIRIRHKKHFNNEPIDHNESLCDKKHIPYDRFYIPRECRRCGHYYRIGLYEHAKHRALGISVTNFVCVFCLTKKHV